MLYAAASVHFRDRKRKVDERRALADAFELATPETAHVAISVDGTAKHLWRMADGELIESVLLKGGRAVFVEDGKLADHQRVALILRY